MHNSTQTLHSVSNANDERIYYVHCSFYRSLVDQIERATPHQKNKGRLRFEKVLRRSSNNNNKYREKNEKKTCQILYIPTVSSFIEPFSLDFDFSFVMKTQANVLCTSQLMIGRTRNAHSSSPTFYIHAYIRRMIFFPNFSFDRSV